MDVLIYSALNAAITPLYGDEKANNSLAENNYAYGNHIKGEIQISGILIYIGGDIVYNIFLDKLTNILPAFVIKAIGLTPDSEKSKKIQKLIYRLVWQTFFNSLIYNNFMEIIIDDLIIVTAAILETLFS